MELLCVLGMIRLNRGREGGEKFLFGVWKDDGEKQWVGEMKGSYTRFPGGAPRHDDCPNHITRTATEVNGITLGTCGHTGFSLRDERLSPSALMNLELD